MIGETYNRLTILRQIPTIKGRRVECQCSCGNICEKDYYKVRSGNTRSCGCLRIEGLRERQPALSKMQKTARRAKPGTRWTSAKGYVYVPTDVPGVSRQEHIVVMEAYLERPLRPGENVHHRNGVKNDNRLSNSSSGSAVSLPGSESKTCSSGPGRSSSCTGPTRRRLGRRRMSNPSLAPREVWKASARPSWWRTASLEEQEVARAYARRLDRNDTDPEPVPEQPLPPGTPPEPESEVEDVPWR